MTDPFENYMEWFDMDNVQQLPQDSLTYPPSTQEIEFAPSTNTELYQYLLNNELSAINYEASSEPITEPTIIGGVSVIAPAELLKSVGTITLPHSFINPFPSPPADKTAPAQSDKKTAEPQMSALASIKEEQDEKDDDLPIDTKKLSSKERRQLRNKISARNFRVRRKEYISTLESQISLHQAEARDLREKLLNSEIENEKLRTENLILQANAAHAVAEMDQLRESLSLKQIEVPLTPLSPPIDNFKENSPVIKSNSTAFASRSSPTVPKPNLNKDVSINGTRAGFMDSRILVSSFELPEWDVEKILEEHRARKEGFSEKPASVARPLSPVSFGPEAAIIATLMVGMVAQTLMEQIMCGLVLANTPLGVQFD